MRKKNPSVSEFISLFYSLEIIRQERDRLENKSPTWSKFSPDLSSGRSKALRLKKWPGIFLLIYYSQYVALGHIKKKKKKKTVFSAFKVLS